MAMNSRLLKFEKLFFVALMVFFLGYVGYKLIDKDETVGPAVVKKDSHASNLTLRDSIVDFGMGLLGTPYVAAGCSRDGFDCSGFVYYVFQNFEIETPRSSADFEQFGTDVPIDEVEKGDLLLFLSPTRNVIGHIGIVSTPKGTETEFIHATSGRDMKVVVSSLSVKGYSDRFVKAVRVL